MGWKKVCRPTTASKDGIFPFNRKLETDHHFVIGGGHKACSVTRWEKVCRLLKMVFFHLTVS